MAAKTVSPSTVPGPATERDGSDEQDRTADRTTDGGTSLAEGATGTQEPAASRGRTSIAGGVVEKIAGLAAREVPGVAALGGSLSRTLGAVRDRVPGGRNNASRGVKVEVGQKQTAVDLDVVVEYGVPITEVAHEVRENVIAAVERMTGLEVVEVNLSIVDVRLPDEEDTEEEARVR
ncbi:Asp23/Gls24 family envelope stress response protein [Streptomyces sp. NPDC059853]|uniref:Asp23/Gls24 family envelope stress response protein n=1 Tax=Streptomyces sp. NPDC059853 TaxID=3346973 RepID=UPI0036646096